MGASGGGGGGENNRGRCMAAVLKARGMREGEGEKVEKGMLAR